VWEVWCFAGYVASEWDYGGAYPLLDEWDDVRVKRMGWRRWGFGRLEREDDILM
jgi:hypothetical protein